MNWLHWFKRWETMQAAFLPQRQRRFDLIALLSNFPRESTLRILDLGCGPGSVTFSLLQQPRQFHLDTLRACGFVDVAVHWQELGEALVGARKPTREEALI